MILSINKRVSPCHKFDPRLCCMADALHGEDEDITLKTPGRLYDCFDYDFVSSATVGSVGTKDLYLRRIRLWWKQAAQLRSNFMSCLNEYQLALSYQHYDDLPEENYIVACYADCVHPSGRFFPLPDRHEERKVSQERFYRAVIACTLEAKAIQLVAIREEPGSDAADCLSGNFIDNWSRIFNYTLQESVENLEIFDYTSNFLLLHVFSSPKGYLDWGDGIYRFLNRRNTLLDNWMYFHLRLQSFLTPFDILSLFTSDIGSDVMRAKASLYLQKFLPTNYVCEFARELRNVENDVLRNLSKPESETWKEYRIQHWRSTIRGRVFSHDFNVSDYSMPLKREGCLWWKTLKRVEDPPEHDSLAISVPRAWVAPLNDPNEYSLSSTQRYYYVLEEPLSDLST